LTEPIAIFSPDLTVGAVESCRKSQDLQTFIPACLGVVLKRQFAKRRLFGNPFA
jgi:hypothetical protein